MIVCRNRANVLASLTGTYSLLSRVIVNKYGGGLAYLQFSLRVAIPSLPVFLGEGTVTRRLPPVLSSLFQLHPDCGSHRKKCSTNMARPRTHLLGCILNYHSTFRCLVF